MIEQDKEQMEEDLDYSNHLDDTRDDWDDDDWGDDWDDDDDTPWFVDDDEETDYNNDYDGEW